MTCRRAHFLVCMVLMLMSMPLPMIMVTPSVNAATLYDSGDPTSAEQLVLEYINRARTDPIAEGHRLGIDIHEGLQNPSLVGPRPPLAMNKVLLSIAQSHSQEMYTLNYFSHNDPNGTTPFNRMTHAGYNYLLAGENMAAAGAAQSATELEDFMMIDAGTSGRPHRVNLLDLLSTYPCGGMQCIYSEVGVGYYEGSSPNAEGLTSLVTEDFGATNTGPFLLGVVYNDQNNNNFYDIGEGLSGVTITTSSGSYYAVSSASGGYAIPVGKSGTISVTATGPGIGLITKTVTLNGSNIKLDFTSPTSFQTSIQSTTQTSFYSTTQTSLVTQTSSQLTMQTSLAPVTFQSIPSDFVRATIPGSINACGGTFANGQSTSCGSNFTATANLPSPSTGWQFNHWTWSGGLTCSSNSMNPTNCSSIGSAGSLTGVYSAQVTVVTNPNSSALISWGSCANPGQGNGASFFSTSYGTASIAACYVPYDYAFFSWSCSGGIVCSGSDNPTTIIFNGPGTITLNLQIQTTSSIQTASTTTAMSLISSSSTTSTTTSSLSTAEFAFDQTVMICVLSIFLITIGRGVFPKKRTD